MFNCTEILELENAWRFKNLKTRDCTFFSDRLKKCSRIDICWKSKALVITLNQRYSQDSHQPMMSRGNTSDPAPPPPHSGNAGQVWRQAGVTQMLVVLVLFQ